MTLDLIIRGKRVLTSGAVRPASVHIHGGIITGVAGHDEVPEGCAVVDAGDAALKALIIVGIFGYVLVVPGSSVVTHRFRAAVSGADPRSIAASQICPP